jgi:hypothetical protein
LRGALATKQSIASPKEEGKLDCFVTSDSLETEDLKGESVQPFIEELASGFGPLRSVKHSATLSKTPAFWARPAMPLGSHPPQWPAALEGPGHLSKI